MSSNLPHGAAAITFGDHLVIVVEADLSVIRCTTGVSVLFNGWADGRRQGWKDGAFQLARQEE